MLTSRAGLLKRCVLLPRQWCLQCSTGVNVWILESVEAVQRIIPVKQQSRSAQKRRLAPAEVAPAVQGRCGGVGLEG